MQPACTNTRKDYKNVRILRFRYLKKLPKGVKKLCTDCGNSQMSE